MSFLISLWPIGAMLILILAIVIWALVAEDYGDSFEDETEDFE